MKTKLLYYSFACIFTFGAGNIYGLPSMERMRPAINFAQDTASATQDFFKEVVVDSLPSKKSIVKLPKKCVRTAWNAAWTPWWFVRPDGFFSPLTTSSNPLVNLITLAILSACRLATVGAGLLNVPGRNDLLLDAVQHNHPFVAKLLLRLGAQANTTDADGNTPVHIAASKNLPRIIRMLATHHADLDQANNAGSMPLHNAAIERNAQAVHALLKRRANPNAQGGQIFLNQGLGHLLVAPFHHQHQVPVFVRTPLNAALMGRVELFSWRSCIPAVRELLRYGADTNNGALHIAVRRNNLQALNLLLQTFACNVNQQDNAGDTALYVAAHNNNLSVVQALLHAHANPNIPNRTGDTPLHEASRRNNLAMVQLLVAHGADLRAVNARGETAESLATQEHIRRSFRRTRELPALLAGDISVEDIREQIQQGALIGQTDANGDTFLHHAIGQYNPAEPTRLDEIAKMLVNAGANVNAQNNEGETPLHRAFLFGNRRLALLLLNCGADISIQNHHGQVPIDMNVDFFVNVIARLPHIQRASWFAHTWKRFKALVTPAQQGSFDEFIQEIKRANVDRVETILQENPTWARRRDSNNILPLYYGFSQYNKNPECGRRLIQRLLEHGAIYTYPLRMSGAAYEQSAFDAALATQEIELIRLFAQRGAKLHMANSAAIEKINQNQEILRLFVADEDICSICRFRFSEIEGPLRALQCGHILCQECSTQLLQQANPRCPTCRTILQQAAPAVQGRLARWKNSLVRNKRLLVSAGLYLSGMGLLGATIYSYYFTQADLYKVILPLKIGGVGLCMAGMYYSASH